MDIFKYVFEQIHTEIIGATKCGKSELLKAIIYEGIKNEAKIVVIDPGHNVLSVYEDCSQCDYCFAWDEIPLVLKYYANEIELRYNRMISDCIKHSDESDIYLVLDNFDYIARRSEKGVLESVTKIAQKGRAANIHLIIAVEDPKCVKPNIATNMTCKITLVPTPEGVNYKCNGPIGIGKVPLISNYDIRRILEHQSADFILKINEELFRAEQVPIEHDYSVYDLEKQFSLVLSCFNTSDNKFYRYKLSEESILLAYRTDRDTIAISIETTTGRYANIALAILLNLLDRYRLNEAIEISVTCDGRNFRTILFNKGLCYNDYYNVYGWMNTVLIDSQSDEEEQFCKSIIVIFKKMISEINAEYEQIESQNAYCKYNTVLIAQNEATFTLDNTGDRNKIMLFVRTINVNYARVSLYFYNEQMRDILPMDNEITIKQDNKNLVIQHFDNKDNVYYKNEKGEEYGKSIPFWFYENMEYKDIKRNENNSCMNAMLVVSYQEFINKINFTYIVDKYLKDSTSVETSYSNMTNHNCSKLFNKFQSLKENIRNKGCS